MVEIKCTNVNGTRVDCNFIEIKKIIFDMVCFFVISIRKTNIIFLSSLARVFGKTKMWRLKRCFLLLCVANYLENWKRCAWPVASICQNLKSQNDI